jgi:hypothetical protein|tara:strand:+ start:261 stop:443 length:183 start_codon:yes stop_codon:yes gene_type:complete
MAIHVTLEFSIKPGKADEFIGMTAEDFNTYFNWRVETGFMDAIAPFMTAPPVKTLLKPVA